MREIPYRKYWMHKLQIREQQGGGEGRLKWRAENFSKESPKFFGQTVWWATIFPLPWKIES